MRFNTQTLRETGMDDLEFMRELANMMIDDGAQRIHSINNAFEQNDWETVGREAHSLKGASLNLGAEDLAALCATIDDTVRKLHKTIGRSEIEALKIEFAATAEEMQRVMKDL